MISSPSARRAVIDRWIVSLTPLFTIISARAKGLKLGDPALEVGPNFMKHTSPGESDKIRRGAVWWVKGKGNCGFHVDFEKGGVRIEAWTGKDRHVSVWVAGKVTEDGLKEDLKMVLSAAGLTDLAHTEDVRASLFPGRVLKGRNALDEA